MKTWIGLVTCMAVLAGCGDDEASSGALRLSINGEEGSRTGYPVEDGPAFVDGWTLVFSKVLVTIANFELTTTDGDDAGLDTGSFVIDLHQGQPEIDTFEGIDAKRWDIVAYDFVVPPADVVKVNDIDDEDIERMRTGGYAMLLIGDAMKGDRTVHVELGLPNLVHNERCVNGVDETDGIVVRANTTTEAEITIHLDHLFFESFTEDEPPMRFEPWAFTAVDDEVTLETLDSQSISDLMIGDGMPLEDEEGNPIVYDPGPFETGDSLRDYVVQASAQSMGHWNGEGHCEYSNP